MESLSTPNFWHEHWCCSRSHYTPICNFFLRQIFVAPKFFLDPNCFWTAIILDQIFLGQNFFGPKFFWTKIFLDKIFLDQNFFGPKSFWIKIYFGPKIFWEQNFIWTKIFWSKNLVLIKFFNPIFFGQKFF